MAELARVNVAPIQLERSGVRLVAYAPPAPPRVVDYPNERAALAIFRKRVVELVLDGWQLKLADADIGGAIASDPAIEAALAAAPDPEQLAVYTDWLIERGDPCGELAALRAAGDPALRPAIAQLEAERGYELYGVLSDLFAEMPVHRDTITMAFVHGWIEAFELQSTYLGTLLAFALEAPMARFVRRLVVRRDVHLPSLCYALGRSPRARAIRRLEVSEPGDVQDLLDVLPALDELVLPGGAPTPDGHAGIRAAEVIVDRPTNHVLIGAWPALDTLTVRSTVRPGVLGRMLTGLPRQPFTSRLRALHIDGEVDADSLAKLAAELPAFKLEARP